VILGVSAKSSIFVTDFDSWPKFQFLIKLLIYDQISIFEQNFDFRTKFANYFPNFDFCPIFRFLKKIMILDQIFYQG